MALKNEHSAPGGKDKKAEAKRARLENLSADESRRVRKKHMGQRGKESRQKLIADVLRIAMAKWNPFPGTCSRARYRKNGSYPECIVADHFGTHTELQREAGLYDLRQTSAYRIRRAKLATEQRILGYIDDYVVPYTDCYGPQEPHQGAFAPIVVISDLHVPRHDEFILGVALDVIRRTSPKHVVINGDLPEFEAVSRWSKNPHMIINLQDEVDACRTVLRQLRAAAPQAQIDWFMGNHEYRLIRFLADSSPELASLHCLRFDELFGLEELGINFFCREFYEAPLERDQKRMVQENWKTYYDCYTITHGTYTGRCPASKELQRHMRQGCSGHVHRPLHYFDRFESLGELDWICSGMMAKADHGRKFQKEPTQWSLGFVFVLIDTEERRVSQELVVERNGQVHFHGKVYTRP